MRKSRRAAIRARRKSRVCGAAGHARTGSYGGGKVVDFGQHASASVALCAVDAIIV